MVRRLGVEFFWGRGDYTFLGPTRSPQLRTSTVPTVGWLDKAVMLSSSLLPYVTDKKHPHQSATTSSSSSSSLTFDLLESVSDNGLVYFLLANLLTGAVNVSTVTLAASTSLAMTLLTVYVLTLSLAVSTLHVRRIRVKFW